MGVYRPDTETKVRRRLSQDEAAAGSGYLAYLHEIAVLEKSVIFYVHQDRHTDSVPTWEEIHAAILESA